MTQQSLELLHELYNSAAREAHNILGLQQRLYELVSCADFSEEDSAEIDSFLHNLNRSVQIRKRTFQMTNLVSDVSFVMMYIVIWANNVLHDGMDINLNVRRKSLESELTKFLRRGEEIHDLFGIRINLLNNEPPEVAVQKLQKLSKYILGILTKSNRKYFYQFRGWIDSTFDGYTKSRILSTLELPLQLLQEKDYTKNPKENGYQSLHLIFGVEMYSPILPGAEIEVQLRTNEMHQNAVHGSASHDSYKSSEEEDFKDVFIIDDFSQLQIAGFTSYESTDDDIDGIHLSKLILNRRISDSLVFY